MSKIEVSKIEALTERVERLLRRHEELTGAQALLERQLADTMQERDSLRSRLNAARHRIDALLDRLPADAVSIAAAAPPEPRA